MVKARFFVQQITRYAHSAGQVQVILSAVSRGEENKSWAAATPCGKIEMSVNNPPAAKWFEDRLGKDILLSFEDGDDKSHVSEYH